MHLHDIYLKKVVNSAFQTCRWSLSRGLSRGAQFFKHLKHKVKLIIKLIQWTAYFSSSYKISRLCIQLYSGGRSEMKSTNFSILYVNIYILIPRAHCSRMYMKRLISNYVFFFLFAGLSYFLHFQHFGKRWGTWFYTVVEKIKVFSLYRGTNYQE